VIHKKAPNYLLPHLPENSTDLAENLNNESKIKFASNKCDLVTYSLVVARIPAAEVDC